jgi:hypothetical protein
VAVLFVVNCEIFPPATARALIVEFGSGWVQLNVIEDPMVPVGALLTAPTVETLVGKLMPKV